MSFAMSAYCYDVSEEDKKTLERISQHLSKKTGKTVILFSIDTKRSDLNAATDKEYITFGPVAAKLLEHPAKWHLPDLKLLGKDGDKEKRTEANIIFNRIADYIKTYVQPEIEEPTATYVETEGIKVGNNSITDINITEKEAEYLVKLKTLLKGSRIIITKGDIKIEVD